MVNILISGYYGFDNIGDESILRTLVSSLLEHIPDCSLTVLSHNPTSTREKYGVEAVDRMSPMAILRAVKKCDMLISGGGSLLQDVTSSKSLHYYLSIIRCAEFFHKKVFIYSQGIGPIDRPGNRRAAAAALKRADGIVVRDERSASLLEEIGIARDKVVITADPVIRMKKPDGDVGAEILRKAGVSLDGRLTVGWAIRERDTDSRFVKELLRSIQMMKDKYNAQSVLIPFHYEEDGEVCRHIAAQLPGDTAVCLNEKYLSEDMLSIIGNMDLLVGVRLHSLIYAAIMGVPLIGTDVQAIRNAEDRGCFERIMEELGIPQPEAEAVTDIESGVRAAARIGYPVLVRPSYVLGGRAMQIVSNEERLRHYLQTAVEVNEDSPVLVDRYIMGRELEVDAICDGKDVFIPGIMEHVEKTGIHSGDSISVYPTFSVSQKAKDKIIDYTVRLGRRIGIVGLYNIQFILDGEEDVYVIEVNPRSSRTVPFLSKATGVPMADIATRVILGHSLREQGITEVYGRERSRWFVKAPAFSFAKIRGMESYLSPEMKSTGEAIGYDNKLTRALYKALQSSGMTVANYGTIFLTIADKDKQDALPLVRRFYDLGFNIEATKGTAEFLRQHGIRTRTRRKLSEGSTEIIDSLRQGHVSYVINTIDINQHNTRLDGYEIRRTAVENNVTIFTALETVKVLLDVLEEITLGVSTIDAE